MKILLLIISFLAVSISYSKDLYWNNIFTNYGTPDLPSGEIVNSVAKVNHGGSCLFFSDSYNHAIVNKSKHLLKFSVASISNPETGQLEFFADILNIYDKNGNLITSNHKFKKDYYCNFDSANAGSSYFGKTHFMGINSMLTLPNNYDLDKYYLLRFPPKSSMLAYKYKRFATNINKFSYCEYSVAKQDLTGDLVEHDWGEIFFLGATPHSNNKDYWLFFIDENGYINSILMSDKLGEPKIAYNKSLFDRSISDIYHDNLQYVLENMSCRVSPLGNKMIVYNAKNECLLLTIDIENGLITKNEIFPNIYSFLQLHSQIIEFDKTGKWLLYSEKRNYTTGFPIEIYKFNLFNYNISQYHEKKVDLGIRIVNHWSFPQFKRLPDNNIYFSDGDNRNSNIFRILDKYIQTDEQAEIEIINYKGEDYRFGNFQFTFPTSLPQYSSSITVNESICTASEIEFNFEFSDDTLGGQYMWTGPNNFRAGIPNPIISNAKKELHEGWYYLQFTHDFYSYSKYDSVYVGITERDYPVILGNQLFCQGDSTTLSVQSEEPIAEYLWSTGETTPTIVVRDRGNYSVQIRANNACEATLEKLVTLIPLPEARIISHNVDTLFVDDDKPVQLTANFAERFEWSTGETTRDITVSQSGTYVLTTFNTYDCTASDTITVIFNTTSVEELDKATNELLVFPVPSSDVVNIKFNNQDVDNIKLKITDVLGNEIHEITFNKTQTIDYKLDVSAYVNGTYTISVSVGDILITSKAFVVIK